METRANFQACENIPVVVEKFILKVKLKVIMCVHSPLQQTSRNISKTSCFITRYPLNDVSWHVALVCSIGVM